MNRKEIRWALSSLGAPEMGLEAFAELAASAGIPLLELRTLEGSLDLPCVLDRTFRDHPEREAYWRNSKKICSLDSSFLVTSGGDKEFAELLRYGEWAARLGASLIRVFGGFDFREEVTEERLERAVANIDRYEAERKRRPELGKLALEVHDGFSSAERCLMLLERRPESLAVIWDAHHSFVAAGEPFEYTWNALKRWIRAVHVKDGIAGKPVLPGEGDVPIPELLDLLCREGFAGPVALEWERQWHPEIPALKEALAAMRRADWY